MAMYSALTLPPDALTESTASSRLMPPKRMRTLATSSPLQ